MSLEDALAAFDNLPTQVQELVEVAMYVAFAQHCPAVEMPELQLAAAALTAQTALDSIWRDSQPGEARITAIKKKYESLPRAWRDSVNQLTQLANNGEIPVVTVEASKPLKLKPRTTELETKLVTKILCRGNCMLPPETSAPWRWAEWWSPIIAEGKTIGKEFGKGLHKVSAATGKNALNLRSLIAGHRPTSLRAIGLLLDALTSIDLRDNMLTAEEMAWVGGALATASTLAKLVMAGNPLDAAAMAAIFSGMSNPKSALNEIDLSRTKLEGDTDQSVIEVGKFANAITLGGKLRVLLMSQSSFSDSAAAIFVEELGKPSPPLEAGAVLGLTSLDLSHNCLGAKFADALKSSLAALPKLSTINLAYNKFGAEAGAVVIVAILGHEPIRSVDLSGTNLCDCSPEVLQPNATPWSPKAISALAKAMIDTSITELSLQSIELCGLWSERVGGEPAIRGTYTAAGIDILIQALEESEGPISLRKSSIKLDQGNLVRPLDKERLVAALTANAAKPPIVKEPPREEELEPVVEETPAKSFKSKYSPAPRTTEERPPPPSSKPEAAAGDATAKATEPGTDKKEEGATAAAAAPSAASTALPGVAEVAKNAVEPPKGSAKGAEAVGSTPRVRDKPGATQVLGAGGKQAPKAGGKTGGKAKAGSKGDKAELAAVPEKEEEDKNGKKGSSNYGGYGQTKKVKKKVEKVVVEEKVSPFAMSPLMVALAPLVVRVAAAHDSALQGTKILTGSLVRVGGQETLSHKEKLMTKPVNEVRMHIELDGDQEPLGWVTGVTRDEMETLKLAARGFPLMKAVRTLPLRDSSEADAKKIGEVAKDSNVRIMETVVTEDGVEKVRFEHYSLILSTASLFNCLPFFCSACQCVQCSSTSAHPMLCVPRPRLRSAVTAPSRFQLAGSTLCYQASSRVTMMLHQ